MLWPIVVFFMVAGGCFMAVLLVLGAIVLVGLLIHLAVHRSRKVKITKDMTDDELIGILPNLMRGDLTHVMNRVHRWADKPKSAREQVRLVFSAMYMDMVLEYIRAHGRDAEEPLLEALKDPRAQDTGLVGEGLGTEKIAARPLTMITTLLREYPSEAAVVAALPLMGSSASAVRVVAAGFLTALGHARGDVAVLSVLEKDKDVAEQVVQGLEFAVSRRRPVSREVAALVWPQMEAKITGVEQPLFKLQPVMGAMVAGDAQRALKVFDLQGMMVPTSKWFGFVLRAFEVNAHAFPRDLLDGVIRNELKEPRISGHLREALQLLGKIPEESAAQILIGLSKSENRIVWFDARSALAKRYRAGVTHMEPGPELSAVEHAELMKACHRMYWVNNIWNRVLNNGLDQYPDLIKQGQWEACAQGMEMIGAKVCARACREVIRHFGLVINRVGMSDRGDSNSNEIQKKLGEQFKRMEREIVDGDEFQADLINGYVIANQDLFLRNRGAESWKGLI